MNQVLYINIDDSGKLVDTEKVSIYAGLVFASKKKKINSLLNIAVLYKI